ncbi:cardiolipin synthase [Anaerorhabdus sp.]|uniref:cardiolipin synthase n=1 Tax=Anaerorhabdus sp. TaxID=1872524 RepID=UPI002FC95C12
MKKILSLLSNRLFVVAVLIIFQLVFMMAFLYGLGEMYRNANMIFLILSYVMVVYVINKQGNPTFKVAWCILILILPIFGGIFYLLFGDKKVPKALQKNMLASIQETLPLINQESTILSEVEKENYSAYKQFTYIWKNTYFPVYQNTSVEYFKIGEEKFAAMVTELKKAKHFIFLEYFIIEEGIFWDTILDILVRKVSEGVLVRVLYDDAGCVNTLPANYKKILESKGIECGVFNPLKARLVIQMNNRDHRKICVIDNNVGFVGGINLADEYINKKVRFGHWKDTAVMIKGEAVWSLTIMFLQFWNYVKKQKNIDFNEFKLKVDKIDDIGFVQPFSDSPTDHEEAGLNVHMNLINNARKYIYIETPYLVIGYEMQKALSLAAKSGVDVRILTPHVPDKWYVHLVSQANYLPLIREGVRIYEYTPGFVHSKTMVSDDVMGICGTINMDYRSYYLHYECGVLMYNTKALLDMKKDFLNTIESSIEITSEDCKNETLIKRIVRAVLNFFAPLM